MSSKEITLNWGIVSAGLICQDFCSAVLALNSPYHVLKGVAARNLSDAKKFAEQFKMPKSYGSYDELYADSDVNIVYIGTINTTHKENAIKAINAGKHVLCEKPMTLNPQDQEEVFKAAKEKGVFFMEGLWTRFLPSISLLKDQLAKDAIGEVKFFSSYFMIPIKDVPRIKERSLGGSTIFDIGIYPIQLACLVMDHEEPIKITASGHLMETGVDECGAITLLYTGGRIAQINFSSNCFKCTPTHIVGEKGTIDIPENSWSPTTLIVNGEKHEVPLPEMKSNFFNSSGLRYEAEEVRKAISHGLLEHPYALHDHSRLVMKIIWESLKQIGYQEI